MNPFSLQGCNRNFCMSEHTIIYPCISNSNTLFHIQGLDKCFFVFFVFDLYYFQTILLILVSLSSLISSKQICCKSFPLNFFQQVTYSFFHFSPYYQSSIEINDNSIEFINSRICCILHKYLLR